MQRRFMGATAVALTAGAAALGLVSSATASKPTGRADSGTTYASIVRNTPQYEYAAGQSTDKLLGQEAITYRIKAIPATPGTVHLAVQPVTLYGPTGSITGTATATLTIVGTTERITDGKLSLTKGYGSLKGHSFVGTFSGSGSATANQFVFQYKGKLY